MNLDEIGYRDTGRKKMSSESNSSGDNSIEMIKRGENRSTETDTRGGWKGRMDFILTCIGYAVGLGNIWRFPYLCYKSGGGAFFIPYFIFLLLCGYPLFFMEASYGQFSSLSPITTWRMSPLFKGVGVGMVMVSGLVCVYYNVIVAWTLYYLFMSFRAVLPWSSCGNDWNTENCVDGSERVVINSTLSNYTVSTMSNISSHIITANGSLTLGSAKTSPSEEYWENHVLELSGGIEEAGIIRWPLLLCLILAWFFVFLCLFKGVKVLGKVMHFAAPFPYLVLLVLLIRGVTLPGAMEGIKFYVFPKWEKLGEFQVWGDAALQIFYSVGMGWGGIVTMASYNKFSNNIYRDALIVPIINCGTSIFAGFVIFSVLGFMAHQTGSSIEEVVSQGPGLTFVAYPAAVAKLPISPLWAVLFFLMLFTIGVDSQFGMVETCITAFLDTFPKTLRKRRVLVSAIACIIECLLGLPLITQGGIYVLQIIDWYCASFSLMLISLTEVLVIAHVYKTERFMADIEFMIGFKPHAIWIYLWKYVTPAVIVFIWLFSVITLGPVTYDGRSYPQWAIVFGWCLGVSSVLPIPGLIIFQILQERGSLRQRITKLMKPSEEWGPSVQEDRDRYFKHLALQKRTDLTALHIEEDGETEKHMFLPSSEKDSIPV
ncbi:sodium- and chloride-dependent glycine transporter 1-like isoform X1 [Pecten maximus]|uniref:sodium- and chloride-dependent glycine transporter 1-like isoform X1 n=2 Tax=Pecten maximus TaxID=6579 RepID=UPI00145911DA|nr:sodium- and chloride-dependent glycine transporter 1-like isoform X1 [Pecten maximus]